jgi:Phasin protein
MEQEEDQRQFFKDLGATAEQTVEEVRGVEEDYFAVLQNMLIPFPWIADIAARMQSYADSNFVDALAFSHELSQAKDIPDFVRINVEFAQKNFKSVIEQARDFAEACTAWQRTQLGQLSVCSS